MTQMPNRTPIKIDIGTGNMAEAGEAATPTLNFQRPTLNSELLPSAVKSWALNGAFISCPFDPLPNCIQLRQVGFAEFLPLRF